MMKMFKITLVSLMMSAVLSASAFAAPAGEAKVRESAEETVAKTQEAVTLMEKGGSKEEVLKLMSDIRQAQKEFRFEVTERQRQKAGNILKAAREEFEKGDAKATVTLKSALDIYKEMLATYNKTH